MQADGISALASVYVDAVKRARARVGDPLARVMFLSPSKGNGEQIRRMLGSCGVPFIHVEFATPSHIVKELGALPLMAQGLRPEPAGWLGSVLATLLPRLAAEGALGRHGEVLNEPGWRRPIESALGELQGASVGVELLRSLADDSPEGQRFGLLATVLEEVQRERERGGLYAQSDVERAAQVSPPTHPHTLGDVAAVIVVGDGLIPPGEFDAVRAWLKVRDVTRIDLPPLCNLPPAPMGLRAAAADAHVLRPELRRSRLGHLALNLFQPKTSAAAPSDESVLLVSTPDEIREMAEVVRTVQRAIVRGVALDRIAIVLPDADQAHVLEAALERASIPATWLTGPSLSRTAAASFLTLALDVANGELSAARWYDLLTHPGQVGASVQGRGRWRRLLARCRARRGEELAAELEAHAAEVPAQEDGTLGRDAVAGRELARQVRLLSGQLHGLPEQGTLGEHGRAWAELLRTRRSRGARRGGAYTDDVNRVAGVIEAWGGGPVLSRAAATGLLREALEQTQTLRGSLTHATIRVLPPMAVLGAEFDLVCAVGMTEGRFPREVRENVLLTDAMIERLRQEGARLVTVEDREQVERRRLAAIVAGCVGQLQLATPSFEMLESRPCQPSSLLLDVASTLVGGRVGYETLAGMMVRHGSRSRPVPATPEDALGAGEFLLARLVQQPETALPALATDPVARRLLQLHRSIDRLAEGLPPDAWTGLVPHDAMPRDVVTELRLNARLLAMWALDPSRFFFEEVLGVRGADGFGGGMSGWWLADATVGAVQDALEGPPEEFGTRCEAALRTRVEALVKDGHADETTREVWQQLGQRAIERMVGAGGIPGAPAAVEAGRVHPGLPIFVEGRLGWCDGDRLSIWQGSAPSLNKLERSNFHLVAQAHALRATGAAVGRIQVVTPTQGVVEVDLGRHTADFEAALSTSHRRTTLGWWPSSGKGRFGLAREAAPSNDALQRTLDQLEQRR